MKIENDRLYQKVCEQAQWFGRQASEHKLLNRMLWYSTSADSNPKCINVYTASAALCSVIKSFGVLKPKVFLGRVLSRLTARLTSS